MRDRRSSFIILDSLTLFPYTGTTIFPEAFG